MEKSITVDGGSLRATTDHDFGVNRDDQAMMPGAASDPGSWR